MKKKKKTAVNKTAVLLTKTASKDKIQGFNFKET